VIGSPVVDEARIRVDGGKFFEIRIKNNSPENIHVQQIILNGKTYLKTYLKYEDIMRGGTLDIEMGDKPNLGWGANVHDRATSNY
jgi:putative alpha-1,2-mannosidase